MIKKSIFIYLILILAFIFYWFELKPAQIKHECSWIKIIKRGKPGHPSFSKEELIKKGLLKNCPTPIQKIKDSVWTLKESENSICNEYNEKIIKEYSKERKPEPTKIEWRKATKDEYEFCLHDKGL